MIVCFGVLLVDRSRNGHFDLVNYSFENEYVGNCKVALRIDFGLW